MIVSTIGGSNSIYRPSYTCLLKKTENITFNNYAIGGTNSVHGLIQIIKHNILAKTDLLIYEYFVNDNNHYSFGVNNVERVKKTLVGLVNMCARSNTKLLFIYIYAYGPGKISYKTYDTSRMYSLYKEFEKTYNITTIDVYDLLYSKFKDDWGNYYKDDTHLSPEGMKILYDEIIEKMNYSTVPKQIVGLQSYGGLNICLINPYLKTKNLSNSLISVDYYTILDEIKIKFDKKTTIIAIEYICDIESGYITINNSKMRIQKNTLRNDNFILCRKKMMVSSITFNNIQIEKDNFVIIKNISLADVDERLYDPERNEKKREKSDTNFKIISLLVTDNASITEILV